MTVDNDGVIHVIFYDDRDYNTNETGDQLDEDTSAKYNVYYTYSDDGGMTFAPNRRLHEDDSSDDPIPALDEDGGSSGLFKPGEYIGISYDALNDLILTSYTGIDADDTTQDQSVIWSSLIRPAP